MGVCLLSYKEVKERKFQIPRHKPKHGSSGGSFLRDDYIKQGLQSSKVCSIFLLKIWFTHSVSPRTPHRKPFSQSQVYFCALFIVHRPFLNYFFFSALKYSFFTTRYAFSYLTFAAFRVVESNEIP